MPNTSLVEATSANSVQFMQNWNDNFLSLLSALLLDSCNSAMSCLVEGRVSLDLKIAYLYPCKKLFLGCFPPSLVGFCEIDESCQPIECFGMLNHATTCVPAVFFLTNKIILYLHRHFSLFLTITVRFFLNCFPLTSWIYSPSSITLNCFLIVNI